MPRWPAALHETVSLTSAGTYISLIIHSSSRKQTQATTSLEKSDPSLITSRYAQGELQWSHTLFLGGHGCLGIRLGLPVDPTSNSKCLLISSHLFLKARFQRLYMPTQNQAIDEAMIPFKGRSGVKQCMPKKPVKRGIKVWVRADSANGFFCDLDVYIGASASPEKGLGARVVKTLTRIWQGKIITYFVTISFPVWIFLPIYNEMVSMHVAPCAPTVSTFLMT